MRRIWFANTPNRPLEASPTDTLPAPDSGTPDFVLCGYISGVHGVHGWVKVFSHTQPIDNLLLYRPWQLRAKGESTSYEPEHGKQHQRGLTAKLRGIDDRDQALALKGCEIWVDAAQFPTLPKGEYYHRDLLGLAACDQQGNPLGTVEEVLETGAHDVLVVRGEQEYLIPYAPGATVLDVDLAQHQIKLRWDGITE